MEKLDITHQVEPVRRSLYDVIRDNLKTANRVTYVHRLIYVGEHKFSEISGDRVAECMESTITGVNSQYTDEYLTGLLLCYQKYFCHILEGSEDSLYKHLCLLSQHEKYSTHFSRIKILVCYHNINQRFLNVWAAVAGKPPTLLEKIDPNCDISRTFRYVYNCIRKLYKLALNQRQALSAVADDEGESEGIAEPVFKEKKSLGTIVIDKFPDCLPEYGLIEFLLTTKYTLDVSQYTALYRDITYTGSYKDKVWPVPTDFIPFNIFDKPRDPVTDLPSAEHEEEELPTLD